MAEFVQEHSVTFTDLLQGSFKLSGKLPNTMALLRATYARWRHFSFTLPGLLEESAQRFPTRPAIKWEGGVVYYSELNAQANRFARVLQKAGVGMHDVVAVMMHNRPELLAMVAAAAKLGACAAMINTGQRNEVLTHSFTVVGAKHYVIGGECMEPFQEIAHTLTGEHFFLLPDPLEKNPVEPTDERFMDLQQASMWCSIDNLQPEHAIDNKEPCFHIFTSGTTGLPKASKMSHDRWCKASLIGALLLDLTPEDTVYAPLPLYHNQALTIAWASAVGTGAALGIRRKFSTSQFWQDCRRFDAKVIIYVGEIARYLVNQAQNTAERQHRVRKALGLGLRPEIWDLFKERFGIEDIYEMYSASELNLAFINIFNLDRTVGFSPLPVTWKIVRWDAQQQEPARSDKGWLLPAQVGEPGLLISKVNWISGFDGYTDPEATERKLIRNAFKKGDAWINSGDLMRHIGYGHLQFVDRIGDTFRWRSENVSTRQVEQAVGSFSQVAEACVYGVEIPQVPGRAGMAAIVLREEPQALQLASFLQHLKQKLPGYAIPVFLRITKELSTTGTFKHRKTELCKEGFNPSEIEDPLYILLPRSEGYQTVSQTVYQQLLSGQHPF